MSCGHYLFHTRGEQSCCLMCGHLWHEHDIRISDEDYQQALALMARDKEQRGTERK